MSKKKLLITLVVLIIIIIIIVLLTSGSKKETRVSSENPMYRSLTEIVSANGTLQPKVNVTISPLIGGEITELYIKEGDEVKEGDLLAKIDPELYITSYKSAEAMLNQAIANEANSKAGVAQSKAQFINDEVSFNRSVKLYKQKVISASDFDSAKANFEISKAKLEAANEALKASIYSVKNAKAKLDEAKTNLQRTSVYAPTNGTVAQLSVQKGERVTGASQFSAGTFMMSVANLDSLEIHVDVNENDIVRVGLSDTAIIDINAYTNKFFKGVVTEIATASESSMSQGASGTSSLSSSSSSIDQVTNFAVKVFMLRDSYKDLKPKDEIGGSPFRPGMSANVDIQTESKQNVLTVPIQAVTTQNRSQDDKGEGQNASQNVVKEYVFVIKDNTAHLVPVKTGIQDSKYIEITEGLNKDDIVITGPYNAISKTLKDGDKVKLVPREQLFSDKK
ncbi:MAG: efflux RND transporter periplasmic adaptor subunit [Hyphomicrobiales bacterium]